MLINVTQSGFTPSITCPPPDISHCPSHPKEPSVRGGGRKAHSESTTSSQHKTNCLAGSHPRPGHPNPTCPPPPPACPRCSWGKGSKRPTPSDSARFAPKIAWLGLTINSDLTVLPTKFPKIILSWVLCDSSCKHFKALTEGFFPRPFSAWQCYN